jgi:hypothetical protein
MISGTATALLVPGGGLVGTALCDTSGLTPDISGTATADLTIPAAWLASDRRTTAKVFINGNEIINILGDVTITNTTAAIPGGATFTVADPNACMNAPGSVVRGAQPVEVYLYCDSGDGPQEWIAFVGVIDAVSNVDPYRPLATVTAIGATATMLVNSTAGGIQLPAFAGYTPPQLVQAYAASAGFTLDLSRVSTKTRTYQPQAISGITIQDLLFQQGELEDWYCRETNAGTLEILTSLNTVPKWDLHEDGYLSLREDSPSHPTTVLTLGGAEISLATVPYQAPITVTSVSETTSATGEIRYTTTDETSQYGVLLSSVVTVWGTYAPLGITVLTESYQIISRTTDVHSYAMLFFGWLHPQWPGDHILRDLPENANLIGGVQLYVPTSRLLSTTHTVEGWYSPLAAIGSGQEWTNGTHHVNYYEYFQMTGMMVTANSYSDDSDPVPSRLTGTTTTTSSYYSPQVVGVSAGSITVGQGGSAGSTIYSYRALFFDVLSRLIGLSDIIETTTGNAILSDADFNIITPTFPGGTDHWTIQRTMASLAPVSVAVNLPVTTTTYDDTGIIASYQQYWYPFPFDDKTYRDGAYSWRETERIEETYTDNLAAVEAGKTGERQNRTNRTRYAWVTTAFAMNAYGISQPMIMPGESYGVDYIYSETHAGIPNATYHWTTISQSNHDGSSSYSRIFTSSPIPNPVIASASIPQYSAVPIKYTLVAGTNVWPLITRTATTQGAENMDQLVRAVRRRLRSEQAVRLTIVLRAVPFLNVWDMIAVWDSARNYAGVVGWVESIKTTVSTLNGSFGQEIVVAIPPAGL